MTTEIRLQMPADSLYSFAPRVVAAWMVAGTGADIDAIDDARLAVDELTSAFLEADAPVEATFLEHENTVEALVIDARSSGRVHVSAMAERILRVVAAEFGRLDDGRDGFRLRLRTSR